MTIYDPQEHELLVEEPWDARAGRAFIERVVRQTDRAFDLERLWPLHPEDRYSDVAQPARGVYCGASGTMWALTRLAHRYAIPLQHDYASAAAHCEDQYRLDPHETVNVVPSYFVGSSGMMMAQYALRADDSILERLEAEMRANLENPTREAFWGSSGTILPALLLRERRADARFDAIIRATQNELWESWEPARPDGGGLLWEQDIYGRRCRYVGAGHGAIGNLAPFIRAMDLLTSRRRACLRERIAALLEMYVLRAGAAINWSSLAEPPSGNRMQWCHGAPGVIIGLARYPDTDERVEALLVQAGEGIWQAGPLRKGPTWCHGTAGNGFALLRLAERTHDVRWTRRAERFAVHAMQQVQAWQRSFGMPAFTLWSGELGVALFVDAVLRCDPALLTLDVM